MRPVCWPPLEYRLMAACCSHCLPLGPWGVRWWQSWRAGTLQCVQACGKASAHKMYRQHVYSLLAAPGAMQALKMQTGCAGRT